MATAVNSQVSDNVMLPVFLSCWLTRSEISQEHLERYRRAILHMWVRKFTITHHVHFPYKTTTGLNHGDIFYYYTLSHGLTKIQSCRNVHVQKSLLNHLRACDNALIDYLHLSSICIIIRLCRLDSRFTCWFKKQTNKKQNKKKT